MPDQLSLANCGVEPARRDLRFALAARSQPLFDERRCTDCNAAGNAAGSVPPACAMSGRPPPLPPTCCATWLTSSPAFTLPVRSLVTPAISVTLPSATLPSTIAARLELVLQLVHRLAQRLDVGAVERRREHLRALDVDRAAGEIVARARRGLRLEARELLLGRARAFEQLRDARLDLGDRRLDRGRRGVELRFLRLHVGERAAARSPPRRGGCRRRRRPRP